MKNISSNKNFIKIISLSVFIYTLVVAFFFQKYVFPHMPSISTPIGVLKGDNELFHNLAIKMSDDIATHGWSAWKLFPLDFAAGINVGVLAAIYYFFGIHPVLILPVNALLHTLSFWVLYQAFFSVSKNKTHSIIGSLIFVLLPTTILWTSQIHKDSYAILAWMLIMYLIVNDEVSWKKMVFSCLLSLLIFCLARPLYVNLVVIIWLINLVVSGLWALKSREISKRLSNVTIALILSLLTLITFNSFHAYENTSDYYYFSSSDADYCQKKNWKQSSIIPEVLDNKLRAISGIRSRQLCHQPESTKSTVDADYLPSSALELTAYLPKAFVISQFYPTPYQLIKIRSLQAFPVIFEMVFSYLTLGFAFYYLIKMKKLGLWMSLISILACELFLAYIIPNMGTYHRIRYPFFSFLIGVGVLGFLKFIENKKHEN